MFAFFYILTRVSTVLVEQFSYSICSLVHVDFDRTLLKFQKLFVVPYYSEAQRRIPFCRVNHNKYMVTDKTAYIGK